MNFSFSAEWRLLFAGAMLVSAAPAAAATSAAATSAAATSAAATSAAASSPHGAQASTGSRASEASPLERALAELRRSHGAEKYAAVRGLWRQWDQGDPAIVEEALLGVERDRAEAPAVRAYASLVAAYARRRRGDLEGSQAKIRAAGVIDSWLVLGPFDNEAKEGLARVLAPERELADAIDLTKPYEAKERAARWRKAPDVYHFGWLDMGDLVRPRENVCVYATTFVHAKSGRAKAASVWMGAAGAFKLWWNGREVLSDGFYRGLDADRYGVPVELAKGWNRLTAKVCGAEGGPMLAARLAAPNGAPDPDLEATADAGLSTDAAKNARVAAPGAAGRAYGRVMGPAASFAALAEDKRASARTLEAFARYLRLTGGDDPAQHQAQDLARRAANSEPTVPRFLLAAELSYDRNEKREWLRRAAKLAPVPAPLDLLLSQADLARTGTNWREATPFYDEVLARDPDNVRAVLGRVELYREAGLKHTATVTLEAALQKNPRSVALLRVYAVSLRDVGRTTEADEAADRYAALRFDDSNYLSERIDLAVMRRDTPAVARWVDRLLAAEPDSAWALGVAARGYRALGQEAQAIGFYQRALELSPEDVETLRAQADLYAESGKKDEQLKLLRRILALEPQNKDVREYVEHVEPPKPRADEQYAWPAEKFLAGRGESASGFSQRTLRDLTVTTVYANGLASRFHQVVFQPLTDEAAAAAREYAFAYQADSEVVQLRAANVYREGGKVDGAIESGEGPADNPELATYTSARMFYVHFPRLNAGDVVELQYRVEDVGRRNEIPDYFGEVVYLQQTQPVASAQYVLRTPKSRVFYFHASALPGLSRREVVEGDTRVYDFQVNRVAPVLPEPMMPPLGEVLGHVHVSTYKSWDDVASWYAGLARDQLRPDDEVRRRVAALTQNLKDPLGKVRAIYAEVVQRTRYVALEFGIYGYKPRPCALTFARGWGDCKDKATLIVTMLKEAGIPASLVLVRTGMRGEFESEPASLAPFDHAIAYVPSFDLFLDGTAEYTGSTELPAMDRGALALIVDESGKGKLTHLPEARAADTRRYRKVEAVVAEGGAAVLDVHTETTGALATEQRQRYHAKGTRRERVTRDLAGAFSGFELGAAGPSLELGDLENIEQPVKLHARGKVSSLGRRDGGELSIPLSPTGRLVLAYASLSARKQDMRLHVQSTLEDEWQIRIPGSYKVKNLPEAVHSETPFGSFAITAEATAGKITVRANVTFEKTRITPAEYPAWRAFCEAADRAFAQRLVVGPAK